MRKKNKEYMDEIDGIPRTNSVINNTNRQYEPTGDTHVKNIEMLLNGQSPDFIATIEKMTRLCIDAFGNN